MNLQKHVGIIRDKHSRLHSVITESDKKKRDLHQDINAARERVDQLEQERLARLSSYLKGDSETFEDGPGLLDIINMKLKINKHEALLRSAVRDVEQELKTLRDKKWLASEEFKRLVSAEWVKLLDEELPRLKKVFLEVFPYFIGATHHMPGTMHFATYHSFLVYFLEKAFGGSEPDLASMKKRVDKVFLERYGFEPNI